ncbi:MAG TPA: EscS/YscS/HrcS family type III secretion system export apparatus protein [Desulfotomaculum sp.]|nr:MAG: flagellar biosynthesis protein FliQ [Peptococcaceae bacterium BRH_c8a]KJS76624.1 MAG: flagellar biosynthesis protein FliQ [Desulfotomaculum sp. BICA1-6]HBX23692.1 EscS/YscS/HrcS family type III secretion system export apparatus protein [Desulfotomaculum sp.]
MTESFIIELVREAIMMVCIIALPPLVVALLVGLVISIMQAATQVQEQSLTFVPKIIAVFLTLAIMAPWSIRIMISFTNRVFNRIPDLLR